MSFVHLPESLLESPENSLVLTPSQRLAMHALEALADHHKKLTQTWETVPIHSANNWYHHIWQRYKSFFGYGEHILLTQQQELQLWKKILRSDQDEVSIVNFTQTAQKLSTAYKLVVDWDLSLDDFHDDNSPDPMRFAQWAKSFNSMCNVQKFVPSSQLPKIIAEWVSRETGMLPLPNSIYLLGFEEITPVIRALLGSLGEAGVDIISFDGLNDASPYEYNEFATMKQEIEYVSSSIPKDLEGNPNLKIAVMAPDMKEYQSGLSKSLTRKLLQLEDSLGLKFPMKSSVGESLSSISLVSDAIMMIGLVHSLRPTHEVIRILRSEYLPDEERDGRQAFATYLEQLGRESLNIKEIIAVYHRFAKRAKGLVCDDFIERLGKIVPSDDETRNARRWSQSWLATLEYLGWFEQSKVSDIEQDKYNSFVQCLDKFTGFSLIENELTRYQALKLLRSHVGQSKYFPPTRNPSVYLLSAGDGACLNFDKMYFVGVNDSTWPQSASPNPFIPTHVQKDHQIPHSSSERELHFAKLLTTRILGSSPMIEVSFARSANGSEYSNSPLFEHLKQVNVSTESQLASKAIEVLWVDDSKGLPLNNNELGKGGTGALKAQSACPAQAYGTHRLGLRDYNKMESGLSASARGNLVHEVLEHFWRDVRKQETLLAYSDAELKEKVEFCVDKALEQILQFRESLRDSVFISLEKNRLIQLVLRWLDIEKKRAPFEVVEMELSEYVQVGPIKLNMKIDRCDKLEDGSLVIIDYKTGTCNPSYWAGSRPIEPQMPMYVVHKNKKQKVSGVIFGSLKPNDFKFKGVTFSEDVFPGVLSLSKNGRLALPNDWSAMVAQWETSVNELGTGYSMGLADTDPMNINVSCNFCQKASFCRIADPQM